MLNAAAREPQAGDKQRDEAEREEQPHAEHGELDQRTAVVKTNWNIQVTVNISSCQAE